MRFVTAFAVFFQNRELVLETCWLLVADLSDTSSLDAKIEKVMLEMNDIAVLTKEHIQRNAELPQQQDDYNARYEELDRAFEEKQETLRKLQIRKAERISRTDTLNSFLVALEGAEQPLDYFDESVWQATVERVTVFHDHHMVFQFLDGTEIEV